jgi:pyrroline-5-carboxylate reductase
MAFELIVVGGGRMGSALVEGLLAAKWCQPEDIAIVEAATEQRQVLSQQFAGATILASLELEHVGPTTGVVLSVKPDHAEAALRVIAVCGATRLLSVVAGLSTSRIEAHFHVPLAVIRSMPNTPVLVGKGVSAIAGGAQVTKDDLDWAESILGAVGIVVRVTERNLDAVTGLSGSGPAYFYLVVEALIDAGVHQGLTREVSRQLVVGTFEGSAELLARSGESPEELRAQVTSPGGTTAAGLRMLEGRAVRAAFLEAVSAAAERSRQLGR